MHPLRLHSWDCVLGLLTCYHRHQLADSPTSATPQLTCACAHERCASDALSHTTYNTHGDSEIGAAQLLDPSPPPQLGMCTTDASTYCDTASCGRRSYLRLLSTCTAGSRNVCYIGLLACYHSHLVS